MDTVGGTGCSVAMVSSTRLSGLMLAATLLASCSTFSTLRQFTPQELEHPIELARARALSEPSLDADSRQMITTNAPRIAYYRQAANFAQYGFAWKITRRRTISVFGEGNMQRLEAQRSP